ncbi:sugar ABC transporter permease [Neomegalonema perideroedes]|uniref:sugar ABC transporter permease n=1 Tax=Neomegalonema perideroedes TaxID=217219 RepID=UPI0003A6A173|nr:sugar ABC transporter permease [Neomegalonema perideroedes]
MDQAEGRGADRPSASRLSPAARFFKATEIDTRFLGMIAALLIIWIGFDLLSGGRFLTARNLWNLSVQSASVAILATGMVLVIVTRNIDLSVGSLHGFLAMVMGVAQARYLPEILGFGHPAIWLLTLMAGVLLGALVGGLQGFLIAYLSIPAFIVTLGGLLVWRGAAWWVTSGQTVSPLDSRFILMGGGPRGAIGDTASWVLALLACAAILLLQAGSRRRRRRFGFPTRPVWAEALMAALGCGAILGAAAVANAYYWPAGTVRQWAAANNVTIPEGGLQISHGIAIPVLIALAAGVIMTFVARRTRFGRYVYAIGGNPEAAELAGVNTRWVTMKIFIIMGVLCAIAGAVASARLQSATNSQGTLDELLTIAAAVIGGTSLAGGAGTIAGALLGALLMQSLSSGMILLGLDAPLQNVVVGLVLVAAVWLDTLYKRRAG